MRAEGKAFDVEQRKPKLSNVVGGLSGPAIRPIAVRMVWECRQEVKIPIIGMGGIMDWKDVIEFMIAGANAVQVGTANFADPFIWTKLLDGITDYMSETLAGDDPASISPTRFHNSVHNAAAGYWTIGAHCMQAATAISAYDASFAEGLLEALMQLDAGAEAVPGLPAGF